MSVEGFLDYISWGGKTYPNCKWHPMSWVSEWNWKKKKASWPQHPLLCLPTADAMWPGVCFMSCCHATSSLLYWTGALKLWARQEVTNTKCFLLWPMSYTAIDRQGDVTYCIPLNPAPNPSPLLSIALSVHLPLPDFECQTSEQMWKAGDPVWYPNLVPFLISTVKFQKFFSEIL